MIGIKKLLKLRIKLGHQALPFPPQKEMPERFRGLPVVDPTKCPQGCETCSKSCPVGAISSHPVSLDLGRCMFCEECVSICPSGALKYSRRIGMSVRERKDLVLNGQELKLAAKLEGKMKRLFGRSLKLRVVTAGSCNGCEMELNASRNIQFDISRFGVEIVASPRHADGLIVTGPVAENMRLALLKTYKAVAEPKIVIALGTCGISGGPFAEDKNSLTGVGHIIPVDLFIAGCPPHPMTIIDGILRLLGRFSGETI